MKRPSDNRRRGPNPAPAAGRNRPTGRKGARGLKSTPTCGRVLKKICSDLGAALDSPECRPIRAHLRTCPDCSAWLDSMEKTVVLFRGYPVPPRRKPRLK